MYNDKYIWIANQTYTFYKYFDWFFFPLLILSGMLSCLSLCSYDIFAFVFRSRRRRDCIGIYEQINDISFRELFVRNKSIRFVFS
jgi:hypothetical protein